MTTLTFQPYVPKTEAPLFPIKTDTRLAPKLATDAVFELIVVTYRKKEPPLYSLGRGSALKWPHLVKFVSLE